MKPVSIEVFFKRGSTWHMIITRKNSDMTPVDLTGLATRVMFREGGVDGTVIVKIDDAAGITITDPTTGVIKLKLTATQSALFTPGATVYFDVEQTEPVSGDVWQSVTYKFKVDQEVTRDV